MKYPRLEFARENKILISWCQINVKIRKIGKDEKKYKLKNKKNGKIRSYYPDARNLDWRNIKNPALIKNILATFLEILVFPSKVWWHGFVDLTTRFVIFSPIINFQGRQLLSFFCKTSAIERQNLQIHQFFLTKIWI